MTHFQREAYSLNGNVATIKSSRPRVHGGDAAPPPRHPSPPQPIAAAISTSGGVHAGRRAKRIESAASGSPRVDAAASAAMGHSQPVGIQSGPLTNPFGLPYVQPQRSFLPRREPIFSSPPRIFVGMFWGLVLSAPIYAFILWMLFR